MFESLPCVFAFLSMWQSRLISRKVYSPHCAACFPSIRFRYSKSLPISGHMPEFAYGCIVLCCVVMTGEDWSKFATTKVWKDFW